MGNQVCHRCGQKITEEHVPLVEVYIGDNLVEQVEMCHGCQQALTEYLDWEANEE